MSELIQKHDNRATIRWKLLTGASALVLTVYAASTTLARAEDADRPQIWIELGGQLDMMQGSSSTFTAPFFTYPTAAYDALVSGHRPFVGSPSIYGSESFGQKQAPARFAVGGDAKITFQPEDSDWLLSAEVRYGRSHTKNHTHYQGNQLYLLFPGLSSPIPVYAEAVSDSLETESEHHTVLDFQAGKDIGLGRFGQNGSSTVNAGIRFAQFTMQSGTHISARPLVMASAYFGYAPSFDQYYLTGHQVRSFKGIGPSLSWNASAVIAGNPERGELALDWGVSGALLFGRQKADTDHTTHALHWKYPGASPLYAPRAYNAPLRSRRVSVPELSGFVGLSAKLPHSKISIGYKGDIWFGAMDTGIDAAKKSNLTFNGPYASISFGLGD